MDSNTSTPSMHGSGQIGLYWGQSTTSLSDAVACAVEAARRMSPEAHNPDWLDIVEFRGGITDGKIQYQVAVRVGLRAPR